MVLSAALSLPKELSENYPYAVMITANPHLEIDGITFTGKKPEISDVDFVDNAEGRIYRKVYVGNMRHTMAAFIGAIEGLTYVYESQQDPRIRPWLKKRLRRHIKQLRLRMILIRQKINIGLTICKKN